MAEMLKAAGEAGILWVTDVCNAIVKEGRIPVDWKKSWMVNVYKGKGDALECGSYRGIKLLDHVMKVFERVIERRVRNTVKIDDMQFGFRPRRGTTDAIFVVPRLGRNPNCMSSIFTVFLTLLSITLSKTFIT